MYRSPKIKLRYVMQDFNKDVKYLRIKLNSLEEIDIPREKVEYFYFITKGERYVLYNKEIEHNKMASLIRITLLPSANLKIKCNMIVSEMKLFNRLKHLRDIVQIILLDKSKQILDEIDTPWEFNDDDENEQQVVKLLDDGSLDIKIGDSEINV